MRKLFTVLMSVAFVFPIADFALATSHEKAAPAAEKAAASAEKAATSAEKSAKSAEKSAAEAKKGAKKPASRLATGTIEAVDAAAGTLTVKGKKGNVDLKAGEKVKLGDFKVGDKVVVKYADGTASSLKAVKAAKSAKPAPETKKAPSVPAPATAPAPAKK